MAAYGFQFQRPQGKVLNCTKFDSATAVAGYCWSNVASNATLECLQELLRMWSGCSQQHKSKWPLWLLSQWKRAWEARVQEFWEVMFPKSLDKFLKLYSGRFCAEEQRTIFAKLSTVIPFFPWKPLYCNFCGLQQRSEWLQAYVRRSLNAEVHPFRVVKNYE